MGSAASIDTTHLFTDEDLIHSIQNNNRTTANTTLSKPQDILINASKRKAASIQPMSPPSTPSYKRTKQITSFKSQASSSNDSENSLDLLIRWLVNNMFLPEWETRHGNFSFNFLCLLRRPRNHEI